MSSEMKAFPKEMCKNLTTTESPRLEVCTHLCLSDLKQIINLSVEETVSSTLTMLIESKMTPLRSEMSHLRTEIEGVRDVVSDFKQMNSQLTDLEKCVDTLDSSLKTANCTAAAAPDIKRSLTSRVENLVLQQLEHNLHRQKWSLVISGLKTHSQGEEIEAQQVMLQFKDSLPTKQHPMFESEEDYAVCKRPLPDLPTEAPIYIPFQDLGRRNLRLINTYLKEELNITAPPANKMPVYGRSYKREMRKSKQEVTIKSSSLGKKVLKTNEMQKTPPHLAKTNEMGKAAPTLPPRKTDAFPKPPARRKKGKKPPLPEKIVSDQEDNQFYEEMDTMTLKSTCPVLPKKNESVSSTKCQQNRKGHHMKKEEEDRDRQQWTPPSRPPCRKMPAIPTQTSNDTTTTHRASMSPCAVSSRPQTELPKRKSTDNPLNAFRWYHGNSERFVVEKKLLLHKKDGMFAVRNSTTKGPSYPYAVTLFQNGKTFNFPIRIRDSDKRFALGTEKEGEPTFAKVNILVDYFKTNKIRLMNDQFALLNFPLDRSS